MCDNNKECCGGGCGCKEEVVVDSKEKEIEAIVAEALKELENAGVPREEWPDFETFIKGSTGAAPTARGEQVRARVKNTDGSKLQRNDTCPCDSGKKFKKCCWDLLNG